MNVLILRTDEWREIKSEHLFYEIFMFRIVDAIIYQSKHYKMQKMQNIYLNFWGKNVDQYFFFD